MLWYDVLVFQCGGLHSWLSWDARGQHCRLDMPLGYISSVTLAWTMTLVLPSQLKSLGIHPNAKMEFRFFEEGLPISNISPHPSPLASEFKGEEEKGNNLGWRKKIAKWCYTFDILQHANDIRSDMQICTNCLIQELTAFGNWFEAESKVSVIRAFTFKGDYPLGLEPERVCRLQSFWCCTSLTALPSLSPTLLQAGGCSPASHTWWDCPPALLPLASGDICGGRPHCGPDHLCQEPGRQGRSHEEAQVLVTGRRIVGSQAQRLPCQCSPALQSPHLVAQEMEGATTGLQEAPASVAAETDTVGRLWDSSPVFHVL